MAVVDLKLIRRHSYAEGRQFGDVGAYEQVDALLTFAVDPSDEANKDIVDLRLLVTMRVEFVSLPISRW
ncbi:MAG: hypothetical protein O2974_00835 [Chloroflexi bacterium]|nr:hypothetical protein [Chloroflexota bacterium]